jgi:hypothetical protein
MTTNVVKSLDEARNIASKTFNSDNRVTAVYVMMTFGEVVVDRAGVVMLTADYEAQH